MNIQNFVSNPQTSNTNKNNVVDLIPKTQKDFDNIKVNKIV
jgi:hypothetical protein